MKKTKRIAAIAAVIILAANIALIFISWILSAMGVDGIRSLISSEGLRWFLGNYTQITATPLLAWMLLLAIAYSSLHGSGLAQTLCKTIKGEKPEFRQRLGLRVTLTAFIIVIAIVASLLLTPHAVLLSPAGDIFPSPFSRSIIPLLAGSVTLLSFIYGLAAGTINNITTAFTTLYCRIPALLPLFILYVFAVQLHACILFVFSLTP